MDYNPLGNNKAATQLDADSKKISLLESIYKFVESSLVSTTNNTTILSDIESAIDLTNFSEIPGNSIEITYYTGVEAGNPSGSTTNAKTIVYKTGVTTILTKTIEYNLTNDVLKVITT
jgi:hypothetical protein